MYRCTKCGKFPFCNIMPKDNCNEFIKRNYETKLTKVGGKINGRR